MNPHADVLHRGDNPWSKRPRTVVAGLLITLAVFAYLVRLSQHDDENVVWIWMGIRSDGRCGRDFGTESLSSTTCGRGNPCCSSHGWCGSSEEYCSPTLGCQSGCWPAEHPRETELAAKPAPYHDEVMYGDDYDWDDYDYGRRGEDYGDDEYSNYHHEWDDHPRHNRYDEYDDFVPARGRQAYYGDDFDLDDEFQGRAEDPDDPDLGEPEPERDPAHAWTEDELEATG
mmetsp:Transcript_9396/g.25571  ORF Transcript_9396/g.25571 Transcript_9396/m.25571 type:complete len:228 (+) Transcript_9396:136-819(+)